jgi:serine/threonine protein phosphatase 1
VALNLRAGFRERWATADKTPGGRLVYAVGDIHGCADLLKDILGKISDDAARAAPAGRPVLVFVGDYVDRGPGVKDVLDQVIALQKAGRFEVRALKGNHEEFLLRFLQDASIGATWSEYGGLQTLAAYGVTPPSRRTRSKDWEPTRRALEAALPQSHARFLSALETIAIYGDYAFVHAGVRPGVPLADQREEDLLWIRDEFLQSSRAFDKVIVYGHTPEAAPVLGRHRIGIDTGAYATGVLTALRLEGAERTIIQATAAAAPP